MIVVVILKLEDRLELEQSWMGKACVSFQNSMVLKLYLFCKLKFSEFF